MRTGKKERFVVRYKEQSLHPDLYLGRGPQGLVNIQRASVFISHRSALKSLQNHTNRVYMRPLEFVSMFEIVPLEEAQSYELIGSVVNS